MNYFQYNIITTYSNGNQETFDLFFPKEVAPEVSAEYFVTQVFRAIPDAVSELTKISACLMMKQSKGKRGDNILYSFLSEREGKFYFNPDVNPDLDTKYWTEFRDKYLEEVVS